FEELAAANPSHKWGKVNVDDNPATAARFQILAIPAFVLVEAGEGRKRPARGGGGGGKQSAPRAQSRRVASPPSSGSACRPDRAARRRHLRPREQAAPGGRPGGCPRAHEARRRRPERQRQDHAAPAALG